MLICCVFFFARSLVTTFVSIRGDGNANIFSDLWKSFVQSLHHTFDLKFSACRSKARRSWNYSDKCEQDMRVGTKRYFLSEKMLE